jgi:hypothetical protein
MKQVSANVTRLANNERHSMTRRQAASETYLRALDYSPGDADLVESCVHLPAVTSSRDRAATSLPASTTQKEKDRQFHDKETQVLRP